MTERRTRRRVAMSAPAPSTDLEWSAHYAAAAVSAPPNSAEAIKDAQAAIFHLLRHIEPAIAAQSVHPDKRSRWISELRLLDGCHSFQGLAGLSLALAELDRNVVDEAFLPGSRKGGRINTERLLLIRTAVEAANEIRARYEKHEVYKAYLKAAGTSYSTVEGWKKQIKSSQKELAPAFSYILSHGNRDPFDLLSEAIAKLST